MSTSSTNPFMPKHGAMCGFCEQSHIAFPIFCKNSLKGITFPYSSMTTSSSVSVNPASAASSRCQTMRSLVMVQSRTSGSYPICSFSLLTIGAIYAVCSANTKAKKLHPTLCWVHFLYGHLMGKSSSFLPGDGIRAENFKFPGAFAVLHLIFAGKKRTATLYQNRSPFMRNNHKNNTIRVFRF